MADRAARLQELREICGCSSKATLEKRTGLWLGSKDLASVPLGVFDLTGLMVLWLHSNQLSSLPPEISHLTGLKELNVFNNHLSSLPPEISHLTALMVLRLLNNQLSSLPPEISRLTGLTYLDIYNNQLSLPSIEVSQLKRPTGIRILGNLIRELPPQITALTNLKNFYIEWEGKVATKRAPRGITNLPCWNNTASTGGGLSVADALRKLQLYEVADTEMLKPDWTPNESQIRFESLNFYGMNISALPPNITRMTNLTYLSISHNQLKELPASLSSITFNMFLDISINQITEYPKWFGDMTCIKALNISQCQLTSIPGLISRLKNLEILDISNNHIEELPLFLGLIKNLRSGLIIHGNPIKNVPENVLEQGPEAIFDFLTAAAKGMMKWRQGRLLLLGEGEAGKTTLSKSIMQKSRSFQSTLDENRQRTDGVEQIDVDIHEVSLGESEEPISARIWDFGGQEEFQVTHPFFLSYGALVLILYRLDRGKEKNNLNRWIKMLDDFAPGAKIIIVGTHQDTENFVYAQEMEQEIDNIKRENKYHTFISTELKVSNMNGTGISDVKKVIYNGMSLLENFKTGVPRLYIALKEHVESKGKQQKYEDIQDTFDFAEKQLNMDKNQCESALKFLHDLGSVVWYSTYENIKGIVFLDPLFLINLFRCVFSFKGIGKDSSGIILLTKLKDKIKHDLNVELDAHVFSTIINIFDHFGLGIHFNKECIAFPSLMEDCHNIRVLWNEKPESDCISEVSAILISDGEVQLSDKSNIIVQALRLTKGSSPEIQYEDYFFRDVAVIHLKASYGEESKELNVVPGNEFIVFIQIYQSNVSIKIRKYDIDYDESAEPVRIFDILSFFVKQISSMRPNFIQNCQLECPECRINGLDGHIMTTTAIRESDLRVCSRKHQLDTKILKQGRVYMEQGISRRSPSTNKSKRIIKRVSKKPDEILSLKSLDEKLHRLWIHELIELVEYIGKGTFGRVYKTKYQGKEAVVKIQTIKQTRFYNINETIESLIFESKYLLECKENGNIVTLFGVYRKDDDFFMILEYAGVSLKTMLEEKGLGLNLRQRVSYTKQICQGLIFMHSKNLYHEDLKADNIMIVNEIVKIVDFGIVSHRGLEKVASNLPTQYGEWKQGGTKHWQAPEIHEVVCKPYFEDESMYGEDGINIGHRGEPSNVYALGMLLWYMFSEIEPFNNESHPESFTIKGIRPEIPSTAPSEFSHLIKACWKQNYKLRPDLHQVLKYVDALSSKQFKLSKLEMVELLPIKHSLLVNMYHGEFVEWLQDFGFGRLSKVISDQDWNQFMDVNEKFDEESMFSMYHISCSDASAFVELSNQNVNESVEKAPVRLVKELYYSQLHDYLKKKTDEIPMKLLEKVKSLKLDGEAISKLDKDEVYSKYYFSQQELSFASKFIKDQIQFDEAGKSKTVQSSEIFRELVGAEEMNVRFTPYNHGIEYATCMWMAEKQLLHVPDSLSKVTKLRMLYLHSNKLTQFPEQCLALTNLVSLDISNNKITSIPSEISRLMGLSYFDIHNNMIQELPVGITALINLSRFCIQGEMELSSVKRAPRGITKLPCWSESSNPDYHHITKLTLYNHDALNTRNHHSTSFGQEKSRSPRGSKSVKSMNSEELSEYLQSHNINSAFCATCRKNSITGGDFVFLTEADLLSPPFDLTKFQAIVILNLINIAKRT